MPIRLVASLHNTTIAMIEKHYSKYITEHSIDDITRARAAAPEPPAGDNVGRIGAVKWPWPSAAGCSQGQSARKSMQADSAKRLRPSTKMAAGRHRTAKVERVRCGTSEQSVR